MYQASLAASMNLLITNNLRFTILFTVNSLLVTVSIYNSPLITLLCVFVLYFQSTLYNQKNLKQITKALIV